MTLEEAAQELEDARAYYNALSAVNTAGLDPTEKAKLSIDWALAESRMWRAHDRLKELANEAVA
ncbi:MAG: hypothetical protein AAFX52_08670 [Pseudomonadota bacterium]